MSASATTAVAVLMVVVAIAFTVVTSASAVVLFNMLDESLYLVVCCFACLQHLSLESQVFPCQWVVEVHLHFLVVDVEHLAEEVVAVFVLKRYDGSFEDMLVVEVVVDGENAAVDINDVRRVVGAIALLLRERELEVVSFAKVFHRLFKGVESHSESSQEAERALLCSLLSQFLFPVLLGVEFVCQYDVLVFDFVHSVMLVFCEYDAKVRFFSLQREVFIKNLCTFVQLYMKSRRFWLILTTWMLMLTAGAQGDSCPQLSPLVRQALAEVTSGTIERHPLCVKARAGRPLPSLSQLTAFVRIDGDGEALLASYGCRSLARYGSIHIASIPLLRLPALAREHRVARIEAGGPCSLQLDTTLLCVNALPAHVGLALPQAFTGRGVVLGIQDIGFDLTHPTFFSPDTSTYRINAFWDQLSVDTLETSLFVGRDYTTAADILAAGHSYDGVEQNHGTLTLGVAAGSGYRSPYRGLAWESDICAVANATSNNAHMIDSANVYKYTTATDALGFQYIFDYAKSKGMPCVISFSEGSHQDHYGDNALYYEVLDSLTGPGRILVAAVGNEGRYITYLHKPVGQERCGTFVSSTDEEFYVTLRSDAPFNLRTVVYGADADTVVYRLKERWQALAEGDTLEVADTLQLHAGEYIFQLAGYPSYEDPSLTAYELLITAPQRVGQVPLSIELLGADADVEMFRHHGSFESNNRNPELCDGEVGRYTILSPSSAPGVIGVGATAWRTTTHNDDGVPFVADRGSGGERATFSAMGPTYDGRVKPDILAPGANVISSLNSYYLETYPEGYQSAHALGRFSFRNRTYAWAPDSGTSMSAPVVSGAVALWLQANPTLTPQQVLRILAKTAHRVPGDEGPVPNNECGYGEIDVYQGLLCAFYGDYNHIPTVLSHQQPQQVTFHLSGASLQLHFCQPLATDATLRLYTAAGQLLSTVVIPAGTESFQLPLNGFPHGVLAVQLNGRDASVTGSTLIRY